MSKTKPDVNVFNEIIEEIKTKFSILSKESIDRLTLLVNWAMRDAFERGEETGKRGAIVTDLKSFEFALEHIMIKAAEVGVTKDQLETALRTSSDFAQMYTTSAASRREANAGN